ncbi:MAG: hypothetical protein R2806_23790 [Saprospiraceae bacterium]
MRPSIASFIHNQTQLPAHRIEKVLELLSGAPPSPSSPATAWR